MTNPESPEYNPTKKELKTDQEMIEHLRADIHFTQQQIGKTEEDPFTGEKSKYSAISPDDLWDRLGYLRIDYLDNLKDPDEKKKFEKQIAELEKKVYQQYIPYIDTRINNFGWKNSPLRESFGRKPEPDEIEEQFAAADWTKKNIKLTDDEKLEFNGELTRLRQKFERYKKEPTAFDFDELKEKLYEELFSWRFYGGDYGVQKIKMYDEKAFAKEMKYYDGLVAKAKELQKIAKGMKDEEIKTECTKKSESMRFWTEREKATIEFPKEYAKMEGTLKDLLQRAKNKETITDEELERVDAKLNEFEQKSSSCLYIFLGSK
ncbi:MAG: hypothetical protein KJ971_07480 [Firmicutes bacterium]|nr:hypothetical protein [Bacillota bacterium]